MSRSSDADWLKRFPSFAKKQRYLKTHHFRQNHVPVNTLSLTDIYILRPGTKHGQMDCEWDSFDKIDAV